MFSHSACLTDACPIDRREFMRIGALGVGGLGLSQLLAARAAAGATNSDTSLILLYMFGGPSQLETYDLKPEAPSEYRSVFQPIATNVPGIEICELYPQQARIADKFAILRSLNHTIGIHNDAAIEVLTGKAPSRPDPSSNAISEHPDIGMIASKLGSGRANPMPCYVSIPSALKMTAPTYLGVEHRPFVPGDPSRAGFAPQDLKLAAGLDGHRLDDRRNLLAQFDHLRRSMERSGAADSSDKFRERAYRMLLTTDISDAFDIGREKPDLRDRYGRHLWGQSCLLARRLAEAGTLVSTIFIDTPRQGLEFTNWDDHAENAGRPGHFGDYMRIRLPYFDQALSALIEDVYARGLDQKIMIVALGEFGRTPRLSHNNRTNSTGRDHWPQAYCALVSGGGARGGQVIGATNSKAEFPTHRPLRPQDLLATIYRHLRIDPRQSLSDLAGRPIPILSEGQPIAELL